MAIKLAVKEVCEAYMFEVVAIQGGGQEVYPDALENMPTDFLAILQENLQGDELGLGWWLMVKNTSSDPPFFVTTQLKDD